MVLCSVVAVGITACNKEKAPTPDELNRNITAYTNNLDEDEKVSDSEDNKTADKENKKSVADKELDNSEGKARKSTKVEGAAGRSSTEEEKKDTKESQGTENSSSEESGKEKEEEKIHGDEIGGSDPFTGCSGSMYFLSGEDSEKGSGAGKYTETGYGAESGWRRCYG